MIKLFGSGGPDHPMADPQEAKRILDELLAQDPVKALEELGHWHETLSLAEGFRPEQRIRLLLRSCRPEKLWLSADCGFSQTARWAARAKLRSMVEGVRWVRRTLAG